MKILIDADSCPVVKQTIEIAKENKIEIIVFCDTSHIINNDYAKIITVQRVLTALILHLLNRSAEEILLLRRTTDSL